MPKSYDDDDGITVDGIYYELDDTDITAYDTESNQEVGKIELDDEWLDQVNVNTAYQRRGIGTKLIELAIEHLNLSNIACVQESDAYRYSLTPQGEYLIASCINKRIITPSMCNFAFCGADILSDDGDGDPGYNSVIVKEALHTTYPDVQLDDEQDDDDPDNYYRDDDESGYCSEPGESPRSSPRISR